MPTPQPTQEVEYGYPVVPFEQLHPEVQKYLKDNPHVAGMAMGGGENGTDPSEPRTIIANPFNQYMTDPVKRRGLIAIEAARHAMTETGYQPNFQVTEGQKKWQQGLGAYATNDDAFKKSLVSRLIAGDEVPEVTPEQQAEADKIMKLLSQKKAPQTGQLTGFSVPSETAPQITAPLADFRLTEPKLR